MSNTSASASITNELPAGFGAFVGVHVSAQESLALHTSMGVGGPAKWFLEIETREALALAITALRSAGVRWMMLGGGSNTLFSDAGFDGAVLHLGKGFRSLELDPANPNWIRAGAAANLSAIMNFAKRQGLSGVEFGAGIPGVLGGALAGNAGAGGFDICSVTESVDVLGPKGETRTLRRGEFRYSYRSSDLRDEVVLGATLALTPDSREKIEERIQAHLSKRFEQPVGERSSGCMFKNPPGDYAGRLIDRAGLKGLAVGGVSVSAEHANFMVNDGTGTAEQVMKLMAEVRERIRAATGITLETEVRVIEPGAS